MAGFGIQHERLSSTSHPETTHLMGTQSTTYSSKHSGHRKVTYQPPPPRRVFDVGSRRGSQQGPEKLKVLRPSQKEFKNLEPDDIHCLNVARYADPLQELCEPLLEFGPCSFIELPFKVGLSLREIATGRRGCPLRALCPLW